VGQHLPDHPLPRLRSGLLRRDRRGHGRLLRRGGSDPGLSAGAPAELRADAAPALPELHLHPALGDRVSAHLDLLSDRAAHEPVQAHSRALPAVHPGAVAALRAAGGDGEPRDRRPARPGQARGAPGARQPGRAATTCCCCCSSATRRSGSQGC
jgi:hypothetical protein